MDTQDVIKSLAEKGLAITDEDVRTKIDTFSKTFHLPFDEACRAAISHFVSANKTLTAPAAQPTPAPSSTSAQAVASPPDIIEKVFALIVNLSNRVPYRLAHFSDVLEEAALVGIAENKVSEAVKNLIETERCTEPLLGQLYPIGTFGTKKIPNNPRR